MARRLEEKGRHDDAVEEIEEALRRAPDSWEVNKEAGRSRQASQGIRQGDRIL